MGRNPLFTFDGAVPQTKLQQSINPFSAKPTPTSKVHSRADSGK
jgi:hypothetical protein